MPTRVRPGTSAFLLVDHAMNAISRTSNMCCRCWRATTSATSRSPGAARPRPTALTSPPTPATPTSSTWSAPGRWPTRCSTPAPSRRPAATGSVRFSALVKRRADADGDEDGRGGDIVSGVADDVVQLRRTRRRRQGAAPVNCGSAVRPLASGFLMAASIIVGETTRPLSVIPDDRRVTSLISECRLPGLCLQQSVSTSCRSARAVGAHAGEFHE